MKRKSFLVPYIEDLSTKIVITPASAAFGTISNSKITVGRRGNCLHAYGSFTCGTVGASAAILALPVQIDFSKLNTTQTNILGMFFNLHAGANAVISNATAATFGVIMADGSTTGSVFMSAHAGANVITKDNGSGIFGNADSIGFFFEVPIVGWKTNRRVF